MILIQVEITYLKIILCNDTGYVWYIDNILNIVNKYQ